MSGVDVPAHLDRNINADQKRTGIDIGIYSLLWNTWNIHMNEWMER